MSARTLALSALLAIVLLRGLWHGWLAPPQTAPVWLPLLPAWLPALPVLIAWIRRSTRAPLWAGIACLLYFSHGVMEAWSTLDARPIALAEVALAVACILAASWPGLRARFGRQSG